MNDNSPPLTDDDVLAFLAENPAFLDRHPEAILHLVMPASRHGADVVDIRDFAIRRLQEELRDMRDGTDALIQTTRINMSLLKRTHQAVLTVLAGDEKGALGETVADDLPLLLDVDVAALRFENAGRLPARAAPLATLPAGYVDQVAPRARPIALRPQASGDARVFGPGAGLVASDALARLEPGNGHPPGLLALGSRRDGAFDEDQASDLLSFVARVVEHCVRQWTFGDRPDAPG
ncbi:DUF484 family protein [Roseospira goensis]|uniref:DUF484 family protein n=1 Tax=Roseospira goensis TaxID=391922 RepID=A0A7W6S1E4_9PROT|nr:DUF484 family protein [Roseospira goensis]MBB4286946.1 hypothetical protein [Roseospira goensis]